MSTLTTIILKEPCLQKFLKAQKIVKPQPQQVSDLVLDHWSEFSDKTKKKLGAALVAIRELQDKKK